MKILEKNLNVSVTCKLLNITGNGDNLILTIIICFHLF